ncbi:MAG: aminotransferase class I/II-fold pyridoxal phosphate-dependent enzyme, partial [Deltaproteobacteria bacterium]|nr:aminotransferase class I/II-fold pyridoxal phosphate-dependent enzyme [Deltaproteobacteria bacterium]
MGTGTSKSAAGRNTAFVVEQAKAHIARAVGHQLMHLSIRRRRGKRVVLPDGREVVEFINCSYLGLDTRQEVIAAAKDVLDGWGVHFCCARSRFSIDPNRELEERLSRWMGGGRAITFPSVTSAHMSTLPLVASGVLLPGPRRRVRLIFDRFAHASMQYLKPILAVEARVTTLCHNDLAGLEREARAARRCGEAAVYVADSVYSMGGVCPLDEVVEMSRRLGFGLYLDDAHGTSIFGARGEGYVLSRTGGVLPDNAILTFSLAKGFGCNGGGVLVPDSQRERLVRSFGQTYAFSAPLDFSVQGAALAALALHEDGTVAGLQKRLRDNVALLDEELLQTGLPFSPIRMVMIGSEDEAIRVGAELLEAGFFVSVAMFPVVPRGRAQLRLCVGVGHTKAQIRDLAR